MYVCYRAGRIMGALRHRLLSPGYAIMFVGCAHAAWGLTAYREPLREIVRAGVVRSVGDGIFDTEHDRGPRAAGFWFLFSAPLIGLTGYLLEAALRGGDTRAVKVGGRTVLGIGAVGTVVMPTSGFPAVLPIGCWLLHRARGLHPNPPEQPERKSTSTTAAPPR
jgi:hypothetical protein